MLGRQRAIAQVIEHGQLIAHVAAELRIARATLSKWVGRYRAAGAAGLEDRSSAPARPSGSGMQTLRVTAMPQDSCLDDDSTGCL